MRPITGPQRIEQCLQLLATMMRQDEPWQFDSGWITSRHWQVVPVESMGRFPPDDIPRLAAALRRLSDRCLVLAVDDLWHMPRCYDLDVSGEELAEVNRQLGAFRFVLTDADQSWAISCAEWCNLFAGPMHLLPQLLGTSIESARAAFIQFASDLRDDDLRRLAEGP